MSKTCKGCLYEENNHTEEPCNKCSVIETRSDIYYYVNAKDYDKYADDRKCCGNCNNYNNKTFCVNGDWCDKHSMEVTYGGLCSGWETKEEQNLKEDIVNRPKHYTSHPSGVECKDITKHFDNCRGQAIQYIWRCEDKGHPITDLQKAIFWLNEKIKMYEDAGHTK